MSNLTRELLGLACCESVHLTPYLLLYRSVVSVIFV